MALKCDKSEAAAAAKYLLMILCLCFSVSTLSLDNLPFYIYLINDDWKKKPNYIQEAIYRTNKKNVVCLIKSCWVFWWTYGVVFGTVERIVCSILPSE